MPGAGHGRAEERQVHPDDDPLAALLARAQQMARAEVGRPEGVDAMLRGARLVEERDDWPDDGRPAGGRRLVLVAPLRTTRDWLERQMRWRLETALREALGAAVTLSFRADEPG